MPAGFTLKGLSPSRASLSLSISPSGQPSPLSSPGRSPRSITDDRAEYLPVSTPSPIKAVTRDEAFKVVKRLEEVLAAWNDYRLSLAASGKAGRRLASAMKDLCGVLDKADVPCLTLKPVSASLEGSAELLTKLSKKVDGTYDQVNTSTSKYFTLLAKESRSHDAYLNAIGKKHDKAEKAYRKVSKTLNDSAAAHSGIEAYKTSLADDIAKSTEDQGLLIGSKQTGVLLSMASSSGALARNFTSFFADGMKKTGGYHSEIEYYSTLAELKWQGRLPIPLDDDIEEAHREEIRLTKTRVALGEMDVVGKDVWTKPKPADVPVSPTPPTPQSAPRPPLIGPRKSTPVVLPTLKSLSSGPVASPATATASGSRAVSQGDRTEDEKHVAPASPHLQESAKSSMTSPSTHGSSTSVRTAQTVHTVSSSDSSAHSSQLPAQANPTSRSRPPMQSERTEISYVTQRGGLPNGVGVEQTIQHLPREAPLMNQLSYFDHPPGFHTATHQAVHPFQPGHNARPSQRRSVSQIAREMEDRVATERQSAFEVHQQHGRFVAGCELCGMDYDRMVRARQPQNNRRVTMPPVYSHPEEHRQREEQTEYDRFEGISAGMREEPRMDRRYLGWASSELSVVSPSPRRSQGTSPDFMQQQV